ncbi:MAG: MMPL family transporter, partial [Cyanobacteria bacterium REEB65]|nr:MMPL family transporter [Cyanobacteria bacterium REEB65]
DRLGALADTAFGGHTALIRVVPASLPDSQSARDLISDLHNKIVPSAQRTWPDTRMAVGGDQAQLLDTAQVFTRSLPILAVLNLLALTLILGVAFRSIVLPIKAVLMNMLPLVAAMGIVCLVFQFGVGAKLIGLQPPGYVMMMTPAILLTVLFALSMDYEVMILSRIREAYDRSGDNRTAILEGLGQSGKVIVGAAAIMFSVFAAYLFSDINPMREVGLALATAILVDATVVRLALLPSAMMLMGHWNYWLPGNRQRRRSAIELDFRQPVAGPF